MGLVKNDLDRCVGCNRCIRVCPIEGANIAFEAEDGIKVKIDGDRCIGCGACIQACKHESRDYMDDTERFFQDLKNGVEISMFAAPAGRTNSNHYGRLLAWLRKMGVKKIYDVSLGADICTWAHIRYIQRNSPKSIITQPCPAIVNYVTHHRTELLPNLSPIHSPMLCTAIYMKKYENVPGRIAALSPCLAKADEFSATRQVEYNVTFKKLYDYMERHNVVLPDKPSGFDHMKSGLGSIYSMPGGLKENVEFFLGRSVRIDKSEGTGIVYDALDEFAEQPEQNLPAIFDVLNCQEGCNLGTGCSHDRNIFQINTIMDRARQKSSDEEGRQRMEKLYELFDARLELNDFVRRYSARSAHSLAVTEEQVEQAMEQLGKRTHLDRNFDCGACGCESCHVMARRIAMGVNIPKNCIQKARNDIETEHNSVLTMQNSNLSNMENILEDISSIKDLSDMINSNIDNVNTAIDKYIQMAMDIDSIAKQINIISLNASVEAARAGQHGKTFAVVASEIRSLADISQKTVAQTDSASQKASEAIDTVNQMVGEIAGAVTKAYSNISEISDKTRGLIRYEALDMPPQQEDMDEGFIN